MDKVAAIKSEICEVRERLRLAKINVSTTQQKVNDQRIQLSEVKDEVAEKEKIHQAFELLRSFDVSKIKLLLLSQARISEAIEIVREIHDESRRVNRYVHDNERLLNQLEEELKKYNEEVRSLTEYLTGLNIQLKFKIESEKKELDSLFQFSQDVENEIHPMVNNPMANNPVADQ